MPTGYTCILEDKPETTFPEFALRCARAFGYCIMQRDEPMDVPPRVEEIPYYRESFDEALAKQQALEVMTLAEAGRKAKAERRKHVAANKKFREKHAADLRIFGEMKAKAEAWKPPTVEHEGLRKFMIEQLEISMPSGEPYQVDETERTAAEWLDRARKAAAEDVRWHGDKYREHAKSAKLGRLWLDELQASLRKGVADE